MKTTLNTIALSLITLLTVNIAFAQTGYFGNYYTHQCRDTNQYDNYTWLYSPDLNNDSNALAIITPNSLSGGVDEDFHCGLWYNKTINRWTIYSEQGNSDTMPLYSGFNVLVPTANGTMFKHKATALNTSAHVTLIDNPATNGNPNALLYISHNWGVSGGVYNNHATGVYYSNSAGKWGIFNEDIAAFPVGAMYNVFVVNAANANAFVYTTGTPPFSANYVCYMDVPALNGNPDASVFVTHNLSPAGVANNRYDTSTVGVGMKSFDWMFYNRDRSQIDSGTTFNVLIANTLPSTGIDGNENAEASVRVYPNPSTGYVTVEHNYPFIANAHITNAMGQQVAAFDLPQQTTQVDISNFSTGVYQLSIYNGNQRLAVKRLIKQ